MRRKKELFELISETIRSIVERNLLQNFGIDELFGTEARASRNERKKSETTAKPLIKCASQRCRCVMYDEISEPENG